MKKVIKFGLLVLLTPLDCLGQEEYQKILTNSTFADFGDYNILNNNLLFVATNIDTVSKKIIETSIRAKNIYSGKEIIIERNILESAIGWIDSSRVLIKSTVPVGVVSFFGSWQGILKSYNVFSQKIDTIPSSWFSSDNHVDNFYINSGKLFYTISIKGDSNLYWKELLISSGEIKTIKKFNNLKSNEIETLQYLPRTNEIIYIMSVYGNKKKIILLSLSTGFEKVISIITSRNNIESSTYFENQFYYLERVAKNNKYGIPDLNNSNHIIKVLNVNSGKTKKVFEFNKGIEVTKISHFKDNQLIVSLNGNDRNIIINKTFDFISKDNIFFGFDPQSYIYKLKLGK